jgi:hypothetical protein
MSPLYQQVTFHSGDGGEHRQHQFASGAGQVNPAA